MVTIPHLGFGGITTIEIPQQIDVTSIPVIAITNLQIPFLQQIWWHTGQDRWHRAVYGLNLGQLGNLQIKKSHFYPTFCGPFLSFFSFLYYYPNNSIVVIHLPTFYWLWSCQLNEIFLAFVSVTPLILLGLVLLIIPELIDDTSYLVDDPELDRINCHPSPKGGRD